MPVKGATISYEDIGKLLSIIPTKELTKTALFINGDHWQGGDGWVGWQPELNADNRDADWRIIERGFTPKNVIKGMVWRVRGAVLGKEPDWEIVPSGRDESVIEVDPAKEAARVKTPEEVAWSETDKLLTKWWTNKGVHGVMKDFISNYSAYGKAAVQIYIPKGYIEKGADGKGRFQGTDLASVLDKIYVHVPDFHSVIDAKDERFGEDYVVLSLKKESDEDPIIYEVHYIETDGLTHVRQVREDAGTGTDFIRDLALDLGGNLLTYIVGDFDKAMISVPVKAQQRQLNHAKTMEGYALANINFPETTFINADLETEKGKGADGKAIETVKPLFRGINRFLNLVGYATQNADGSESLVTPDVRYKPQADPEKFAKVAENNTRDMHQEAGMLYILLSSSPYPSGDSRVESMTDYLILLVDYKTLADTLGVWLLETVLRLAFHFTGESDKNDKFSVIFSSKITIGRVSTEDKAIMLQEVAAQLRSRRNYMVTAEVSDDPAMELKVIVAEPPPIQPNAPDPTPNPPAPNN